MRTFTTAWFAKAAAKAGISRVELCKTIAQVANGQANDLGGGMFKKRINKNMHRCIVTTRGRQRAFFVYLFAKKDRENIEDDELDNFRKLARSYETLTDRQLALLLHEGALNEICHEETKV
jgi:hypothetical protein